MAFGVILNPDSTTDCPVCGHKVHHTIEDGGIRWKCVCGAESLPGQQWDNIKFRILGLVMEQRKSNTTMGRQLLGAWLQKLGSLIEEYPEWSKIVDSAIDMTW